MLTTEIKLTLVLGIGLAVTYWVKEDVNTFMSQVDHTLEQRERHYADFPEETPISSERVIRPDSWHQLATQIWCREGVNCTPLPSELMP